MPPRCFQGNTLNHSPHYQPSSVNWYNVAHERNRPTAFHTAASTLTQMSHFTPPAKPRAIRHAYKEKVASLIPAQHNVLIHFTDQNTQKRTPLSATRNLKYNGGQILRTLPPPYAYTSN